MQANFIVRLIDLTLLLLLSLFAVVRITEYDVNLPVSHELEDQGSLTGPIQAAVSVEGNVFVEGVGQMSAQALADISDLQQRAVELRVDAAASAFRLLEIHQILEQASRPAVFIVEHRTR